MQKGKRVFFFFFSETRQNALRTFFSCKLYQQQRSIHQRERRCWRNERKTSFIWRAGCVSSVGSASVMQSEKKKKRKAMHSQLLVPAQQQNANMESNEQLMCRRQSREVKSGKWNFFLSSGWQRDGRFNWLDGIMSSSMRLLHPSVSNLGGVRVCRPSDAAADLKSMPTNNNERSCIGWGVKAGLLGRIKLSLQWIRRATFSLSIYGYISRPFSIIFFHIGPELTHADQRAETSPIYPSTDPPTSCPPLSFSTIWLLLVVVQHLASSRRTRACRVPSLIWLIRPLSRRSSLEFAHTAGQKKGNEEPRKKEREMYISIVRMYPTVHSALPLFALSLSCSCSIVPSFSFVVAPREWGGNNSFVVSLSSAFTHTVPPIIRWKKKNSPHHKTETERIKEMSRGYRLPAVWGGRAHLAIDLQGHISELRWPR